MEQYTFPDTPRRGTTPPATIDNVAHLLDQAGIRCRYNDVKKKVEIEIPDHRGTFDNLDNVTLTHVFSLASKHGMPTSLVGEFVNAVADRHAYNPVADWIRSKAWDGADRFEALDATVVAQADYPDRLKRRLLRKWLRSAAAASLVKSFKARGVLTLQGRQGLGKTSWVKALVSEPALRDSVVKLDHHLDPSNKDSILSAVDNWIVEIGELDSSFKRDIARLKGFLTADSDRVRRPYDRRASEYQRRTVFAATVNEANFLVDTTGNSRWWTIAVDSLDYQHAIDMQQLFAQLAGEVEAGKPWWLDNDEEAMLAAWNERHQSVSVIAEMLMGFVDLDLIGSDWLPAITASETLKLLGYERPTNAQAKECGGILRDLFGPPKRVRGIMKWRVPVSQATAADLNLNKGAIASAKMPRQPDPNEIF